jgi:tetratricopeptide (TPR) repeat protein
LINLATVHKDLNEHDHAVKLYEKAIEGRKVTEGEDSINYAMVKAMAAGAYRELGDYKLAEAYLKEAYMTVAMEHGEDNMTASAILNSMGLLYKRQGKFERSLDAYQRSLRVREELLGEDHPDSLSTRHNLAELYIEWGKPESAQEFLNKNVELMEAKSAAQ